ncbi:Similar to MTMR6: Myotubularin-related protein 6 (Homo sapiens) [Cotesia congregata]|uniref:phosphatidylinositol-3,5-bisphosphate 3-phosphatase n=1 Tax=Cotesia congregata TaxID=51543 RepID=A0A8J2EL07_COTCN|nr:Similar to MTMR6: Myotubularin-related protein 6 (Homo sapiens) [Cotesia congregata]
MNPMELIKIGKVENVRMLDRYSNKHSVGTLYLTATHLIFTYPNEKKQIWVLNTHIASIEKQPLTTAGSPLHIKCKHFLTMTFIITKERDCHDIYLTLMRLSSPARIDDVYCFHSRISKNLTPKFDGWSLFDIQNEFQRQGLPNSEWTLTYLNTSYELCDTYPRYLYVPSTCTNNVLVGSAKFRSKGRLPVLTYLHSNKAAICRCSQPLSGFNARCPEDEQMLYHILCTNPNAKFMYVVDTRPRINAMANRAAGKGYENENFYDNIKFRFFGIENIHVMRASLSKLIDLQKTTSMSAFLNGLESSGWLKHIRSILETSWFIAKAIINGTNVVVHCSDGWDRTAQVCSVAALLLDPFYRTIQGFQALIEKDWLAFGHKFSDRCGHITSDPKELAPIFTQFIDVTYQLMHQFPYMFQFNEYFLLVLHDHVHSCQHGTFIGNNEKERQLLRLSERTKSLWEDIAAEINEYINPLYACNNYKDECNKVLEPKLSPQNIELWKGLYFRFENGIHPRETGQDYVLALHNHTTSLEDHVKLLIKRVNNLSQLPKSQQNNQPNYNYDDEFSKDLDSEKIIDKDENDIGGANNDALVNQIESELKSVALDWKTSSKVEECSCCSTFDAFNKKNHCWSCGDVFCIRCIEEEPKLLSGHLSQRPVPTCKSCSRRSPITPS